MKKSEELGKLIGMTSEGVEKEIDKGMWNILIELNKKGYYTVFCCEGHPENHSKKGIDYWCGYLAFIEPYKFKEYPPMFSKTSRNRSYFYWDGNGEDKRQEFLENVYKWACCLPTRERRKVVTYHLLAKHKNQPNREAKLLCYTNDYEDIRCILNRADMNKYYDFKLMENVKYV